MEKHMFNHTIKKFTDLLNQEENINTCLLIKLQKNDLAILSKNETKLSAVYKFQENISKKALNAKQRKEAFSEQLQEMLITNEEDNQAVHLKLHEKEILRKKLEELRRKKDKLVNNRDETSGQQINTDNLKNCLKACKILTKTHFDFGNSVCGYTLNEDLSYKCFELKRQESQHKITEYLWNNLPTKNSITTV